MVEGILFRWTFEVFHGVLVPADLLIFIKIRNLRNSLDHITVSGIQNNIA